MLDIWLPEPLYRLKPWGLIGCGILCGQTLTWPWAAWPTFSLCLAGFLVFGLRGLRPW